ncbi:MAG: type II toxin-antitoxin system VapB family antitoxin [Caldilinea sp.]|nr:type II toxin-antitoxin system VapB family antitoxin [Caldilinea sp.]MCB0065699.1 type II toxin-antitoxin system VapB family antitoxin [Caldilineaceae bacterium]MCB0038571.1 type II toxin-antitoxin system VapB family antitoxin [Caldilinea sp.]MCB0053332.1 type II toxin-antitoxin system VapB family antitoxin [Caldilinea sp.]MCB0148546.1 type II toxin-antitoxin system VapB family antitoxin [Caldilineaceae bacterium]
MRTTIQIDDDLLTDAKLFATRSGTTLTAVIEDALRAALARSHAAPERRQVKVTTVEGNGPQPGVDLDDSAALLAHMDANDDSA